MQDTHFVASGTVTMLGTPVPMYAMGEIENRDMPLRITFENDYQVTLEKYDVLYQGTEEECWTYMRDVAGDDWVAVNP
ncbi:MAG: hypothetical protein AAFN11_08790 [Chloroflexota bacterium]